MCFRLYFSCPSLKLWFFYLDSLQIPKFDDWIPISKVFFNLSGIIISKAIKFHLCRLMSFPKKKSNWFRKPMICRSRSTIFPIFPGEPTEPLASPIPDPRHVWRWFRGAQPRHHRNLLLLIPPDGGPKFLSLGNFALFLWTDQGDT